MAAMTITTQERLDAYLEAEALILTGQRGRFNGREVELADLAAVQAGIREVRAQLVREQRAQAEASRGRGRSFGSLANLTGCRDNE